jgi:hypothetical protein
VSSVNRELGDRLTDQKVAKVDPNAAAGSAGYAAQLDDGVLGGSKDGKNDKADEAKAAQVAQSPVAPPITGEVTPSSTSASDTGGGGDDARKLQVARSRAQPSGLNNGLEVRRGDAPTVKELPADTAPTRDLDQTVTLATDSPSPPAAPHFAAPATVAKTPSQPPANAPVGTVAGAGGAGPSSDNEHAAAPTPPPAAPPPPSAPKPEQRGLEKKAEKGDNANANANTQESAQNEADKWAEAQHKALVTLVQQDNCDGAANLALKIEGRTPDYYNRNVATDRAVRKCLSYINTRRQAQADEAQKRAASRAKAADEPSATKR